jgi:low affinity Fe/Cu permease
MKINSYFGTFAKKVAIGSAHPLAFALAFAIVFLWALSGPLFNYSDTWQLVINTGTTVVTFLMVFLIQHTQNIDTVAVHLKLDELIRAIDEARNNLIDLEDLNEEEVAELQKEYSKMAEEFRKKVKDRK